MLQFHEALELSKAQNIPVTEELADQMTEERTAKGTVCHASPAAAQWCTHIIVECVP